MESTKSTTISVTPLTGGRNEDGVCALLEIGGARLLLDCGCSSQTKMDHLSSIVHGLKERGGVNAILISHADIHHMGAVPVFLGRQGLNVPIVCTTPVYKFGQIVLYDFAMNKAMEGIESDSNSSINTASASSSSTGFYDFDDIDRAFENHIIVKFNQTITIPDHPSIPRGGLPKITVSALRSGRTIGGSIWKIRCGPTEILYTMDINLKKESVLNGVNIELLPSSPALMIVEGGCASRLEGSAGVTPSVLASASGSSSSSSGGATSSSGSGARRKKDKLDGASVLTASLMKTMRAGGNVLIPCETAGRSLELLQLLGKFWYEQRLGLYNLVFLSHMSKNMPEFARMQLEWMSDSLSRGFYNGKPNPFDLPQVRFLTSLREMERKCVGPKVVLATDASLSAGLSKELLLKWGGDPRCRVLFLDASDAHSLAAELRGKYKNAPVIAAVNKPVRVELSGQELVQYRAAREQARRLREDALQRKRRQEELSLLNVGDVELVDDEDDAALQGGGSAGSSMNTNSNNTNSDVLSPRKRPKGAAAAGVDALKKFLEPNFSLFESREPLLTIDEFGASIDDLEFRDIQNIESRWYLRDKGTATAAGAPAVETTATTGADATSGDADATAAGGRNKNSSSNNEENDSNDDDDDDPNKIPTKIVPTSLRVQFTCEFGELGNLLGGRADFKAIKTLVHHVTPTRLLVLRGKEPDCQAVLRFAKASRIEGFAPQNGQTVSFQVQSEKLRIQVPQTMLPTGRLQPVQVYSTATSCLVDSKCSVAALSGVVAESSTTAALATSSSSSSSSASHQSALKRQQEGIRLVKFRAAAAAAVEEEGDKANVNEEGVQQKQQQQQAEEEGEEEKHHGDMSNSGESMEVEGGGADDRQTKSVPEPTAAAAAAGGGGGGGGGAISEQTVDLPDSSIGVVSVGEVTLNSLRQLIEASGTSVEYRIDARGAVLVCADQVIIRKQNVGDFIIEGPPIPAFYEARKALYRQFAFV